MLEDPTTLELGAVTVGLDDDVSNSSPSERTDGFESGSKTGSSILSGFKKGGDGVFTSSLSFIAFS